MSKDIVVLVVLMTVLSITLIVFGWGSDGWLFQMALIFGGIFMGYVLTEVLNAE